MNFFYKLMHGECASEDIHNFIEMWHQNPRYAVTLHQFLGMTEREFARWVQLDATLETLVQERMDGVSVEEMSAEELLNELPIATREDVKIEIKRRFDRYKEDVRMLKLTVSSWSED